MQKPRGQLYDKHHLGWDTDSVNEAVEHFPVCSLPQLYQVNLCETNTVHNRWTDYFPILVFVSLRVMNLVQDRRADPNDNFIPIANKDVKVLDRKMN